MKGIAVRQLDLSGEVIATHDNMTSAMIALGKQGGGSMIKKSCEDGKVRYGYRWSYSNPDALIRGKILQHDPNNKRIIAKHNNSSVAVRALGKKGGGHEITKSCQDGRIRYGYKWSYEKPDIN